MMVGTPQQVRQWRRKPTFLSSGLLFDPCLDFNAEEFYEVTLKYQQKTLKTPFLVQPSSPSSECILHIFSDGLCCSEHEQDRLRRIGVRIHGQVLQTHRLPALLHGFAILHMFSNSQVLRSDTDSLAIAASSPLGEEENMLKAEVLASPALMGEYRRKRAELLSDGSVEDNCVYGCVFSAVFYRHRLFDSFYRKWKLEKQGASSACFVAPKLYSYAFDSKMGSNALTDVRAKGATRRSVEDKNFQDFVALMNPSNAMPTINTQFSNYGHLMVTTKQTKRLRSHYDKRLNHISSSSLPGARDDSFFFLLFREFQSVYGARVERNHVSRSARRPPSGRDGGGHGRGRHRRDPSGGRSRSRRWRE